MVTKPQGQQEVVSWEPDLIVHSNAHPSEGTNYCLMFLMLRYLCYLHCHQFVQSSSL